jgi:biotin carboxylase
MQSRIQSPISKQAAIIVDYNNASRRPDVRTITTHVRGRGLVSVLVRRMLAMEDETLADVCIEGDPVSTDFVADVTSKLSAAGLNVRAVLPFSDRAVIAAARLAEALGVSHDSPSRAERALSKIAYRVAESGQRDELEAQGFFVPRHAIVRSVKDIAAFQRTVQRQPFILKPSREGNNRGVVYVMPEASLDAAYGEAVRYADGGLLCEEYIPFDDEYSFDGVGDLSFITRKLSAGGRYPVEIGQVVPADIGPKVQARIRMAGRHVNRLVGQRTGAFHNEIRHCIRTNRVAVVEPNCRPAGMKIWSLAKRAFGVDFYEVWLEAALGRRVRTAPLRSLGIAAIRMLRAPRDGVFRVPKGFDPKAFTEEVSKVVESRLRDEFACGTRIEVYECEVLARDGVLVEATPRDNAGFMAHICVFFPGTTDAPIDAVLMVAERAWWSTIDPFVVATREPSRALIG